MGPRSDERGNGHDSHTALRDRGTSLQWGRAPMSAEISENAIVRTHVTETSFNGAALTMSAEIANPRARRYPPVNRCFNGAALR